MNHSPCIMIQCIFPGKHDIKDTLLHDLQKHIQRFWPNARIVLQSYADYPKIEGDKKAAYGLTHSPEILVHDLIKNFDLAWNYRESMVRDVDTQLRYNQESAIWSQLCHPDETFLLPAVEWVHIYTWN